MLLKDTLRIYVFANDAAVTLLGTHSRTGLWIPATRIGLAVCTVLCMPTHINTRARTEKYFKLPKFEAGPVFKLYERYVHQCEILDAFVIKCREIDVLDGKNIPTLADVRSQMPLYHLTSSSSNCIRRIGSGRYSSNCIVISSPTNGMPNLTYP